ncbi:5-hydroxytryptamine receptor 2B [Folsomia candida]|uniref:5-hydroxytryptamine receptor 2B n=1 Tax=Folsomia candida TaxID=158441 RepID=UPI000B8FFB81|nr:5-hydroxytryptamine receptor 2B [Folsomia candida]
MDNCTYGFHSYEHDDSFESYLECLHRHMNDTQNGDEDEFVSSIGVGIVLGLLALVTVAGNVAVLVAIWIDTNLRSLPNYLIFSLTVAHLIVGCTVLPFAAGYEMSKAWPYGEWGCITWLSCDVLAGTALMLHVAAIAVDRYWSLKNIEYVNRTASRRVRTTLIIVWVLALVITMTQLFWEDDTWNARIEAEVCTVNQDEHSMIFATLSSFIIPLVVVLFLSWKIFRAERMQVQKRRFLTQSTAETSLITTISSGQDETVSVDVRKTLEGEEPYTGSEQPCRIRNSETERPHFDQILLQNDSSDTIIGESRKPNTEKSKTERKTAQILGIVTVACHLPFIVMLVAFTMCGAGYDISHHYALFIYWLSYSDSMISPIIYFIRKRFY